MSTDSATRLRAAGVIGLETTGVADRSIAMDILHALIESHGLHCAFHHDMAFDPPEMMWRAIETTPDLDLLLVAPAEGRVPAAPAMTWSGDAEAGWPRIPQRLAQRAPHLRPAVRDTTPSRFAVPASTARSVSCPLRRWIPHGDHDR